MEGGVQQSREGQARGLAQCEVGKDGLTILCGVALGWAADREGTFPIALPAVAAATGLTLAGYLLYLFKNWRRVLRQLSARGLGGFQWDSLRILAWSFVLRSFVMGTAGFLAYWISATFR